MLSRHPHTTTMDGRESTVERNWTTDFSIGSLLAAAVGVVVLVFGVITLFRTGVDSDLTRPATTILGVTETAGIGIAEIVAGVLILISALDAGLLGLTGAIGVLGLVAGIVGLFASAQVKHDVGFDSSTAWFFVIWGAAAMLASMMPVISRRGRSVDVVD